MNFLFSFFSVVVYYLEQLLGVLGAIDVVLSDLCRVLCELFLAVVADEALEVSLFLGNDERL